MLALLHWLGCLGLALQASAAPSPRSEHYRPYRRDNVTSGSASTKLHTLPIYESDPIARALAIDLKRSTFLYGPSIAGNSSFWPTGVLGNASVLEDYEAFQLDSQDVVISVEADEAAANAVLAMDGGITKLSDYELLYENQWRQSIPAGLDKGIMSNYTNDLLFSMERLSVNPYSVKRLNPASDSLPFEVDDSITQNITGTTFQSLFQSGRLFYVDHRGQANIERTSRYAAACDAYFYIHPTCGDFLPLAIRSNIGNDLVYTPADTENDWLLAKIMFNLNDFWHGQWYHLAGTHNVVEIIYEAAFRTLGEEHPIMALLERLTLELFAYRISAVTVLINEGGFIDQYFAFSGNAAAQTTTELYQSGSAGAVQSNYFYENLSRRGLINSTIGPDLKSFPFLEDASVIYTQIEAFMSHFVDSYYHNSSEYTQDQELQAWFAEAIPAAIIDFPNTADRANLINILTHVAFLGSVAHQTLNTNEISEASGSLPFHPVALYQPIPTRKGVADILPFLPNATMAIGQIGVTAFFARPEFINSDRSLTNMFDDAVMLAKMNAKTTSAAQSFKAAMQAFSQVVAARTFDDEGLCQGMPFIWKALDPEIAPYYLTI